ncbi:MAG TPA: CsgG/HfaB family protein [Vicinamibacteria bacterium]|jgi:curli biogenesis system outer membrane secretion channel CsgG|nr:CsgG/HfaB family protein [Vicinamibacteria bacterium]
MKGKLVAGLTAAVALVGLSGAAQAQSKKADRPKVAVMDFDYGTVNNWWGQYDIGKGMADQVVDALVNDGSFRVIERKKLDTVLAEQDFARSDRADPSAAKLAKVGKVLGVKYIIAGSITKFGGEEKTYGGGGFGGGKIGGLGLKKAKTYVTLTARMIDATTGEVLISAKGEGLSTKGGGLALGGAGGGGGAGFAMGTSNYKDSAIGDAQEQATQKLVAQLVARKDRLEE